MEFAQLSHIDDTVVKNCPNSWIRKKSAKIFVHFDFRRSSVGAVIEPQKKTRLGKGAGHRVEELVRIKRCQIVFNRELDGKFYSRMTINA